MNKQEIENKLEEIYKNYMKDDKYCSYEGKECIKTIYNFALKLAAENATIDHIKVYAEKGVEGLKTGEIKKYNSTAVLQEDFTMWAVDKQSILDLKL